VRSNQPFSLLLIDIDNFKAYNDDFGHQAGDDALSEVARLLQYTVRSYDMAARYGGEEFAAVLPDTTPEQALQHAEVIRAHVASLNMAHAPTAAHPQVTLSIGVASFDKDRLNDVKSLLEAADRALYLAKRAGRNRVIVGQPA
jgi:diguanylate cyclase (GGDEF)-like protein